MNTGTSVREYRGKYSLGIFNTLSKELSSQSKAMGDNYQVQEYVADFLYVFLSPSRFHLCLVSLYTDQGVTDSYTKTGSRLFQPPVSSVCMSLSVCLCLPLSLCLSVSGHSKPDQKQDLRKSLLFI